MAALFQKLRQGGAVFFGRSGTVRRHQEPVDHDRRVHVFRAGFLKLFGPVRKILSGGGQDRFLEQGLYELDLEAVLCQRPDFFYGKLPRRGGRSFTGRLSFQKCLYGSQPERNGGHGAQRKFCVQDLSAAGVKNSGQPGNGEIYGVSYLNSVTLGAVRPRRRGTGISSTSSSVSTVDFKTPAVKKSSAATVAWSFMLAPRPPAPEPDPGVYGDTTAVGQRPASSRSASDLNL